MPLEAVAAIIHNQFVVIMVDESVSEIGGCSIDKSVSLMKNLGEKYGFDFFNRLLVYVHTENGPQTYSKRDLQEAIDKSLVNPESLVFNHLVQTKHDFSNNWLQTLENNWVSRQLKFLV